MIYILLIYKSFSLAMMPFLEFLFGNDRAAVVQCRDRGMQVLIKTPCGN
jgi:hypothetical protein